MYTRVYFAFVEVSSFGNPAFNGCGEYDKVPLDMLCLVVPQPIAELLARGLWCEVMLLARWLLPVAYAQALPLKS
jgi:hypothetical protein